MNEKMKPHIRWMIRRDLESVLDIADHSFEEPWTREEFIAELRKRNTIGMVAVVPHLDNIHADRITGYIVYEIYKDRYHIINIAVHEDYRRLGIASEILKKMRYKLTRSKKQRISIHVGDWNLKTHLLLRKQGYKAVSVVKEFYTSRRDAYEFQLTKKPSEKEVNELIESAYKK